MSRNWVVALGLLPAIALGQVTYGPALTGTTSVVNNGPGDQTDPHVSCDSVAYTSDVAGSSQIRYHDVRVNTDNAVPNNGAFDSLSDVNGTRIVFTRTIPGQSSIYLFDTATPAVSPVELSPLLGSERRAAALGGNTVAWQDFTFGSTILDSEIVVYDIPSHAALRLTTDALLDRTPAVSPDGNVVAFAKCDTSGTTCDIYTSVKSGGVFSAPQQLTGALGDDTLPDTNGTVVVYGSSRGGGQDIYFQPVNGGTESQLVLPGDDVNPNVAGSLVAFEHLEPGALNRDLLLYDMATQTAYRLTNTPALDETLNDISVCADGLVRVVYTVREGSGSAASFNVYAFSFRMGTTPPPACTNGTCASPGTRPLFASFEVSTGNRILDFDGRTFTGVAGPGLLCIDNAQAALGLVKLNKKWEVAVSSIHGPQLISRQVTYQAQNSVSSLIVGKPHTSFKIRAYGTDPACAASALGTTQQGLESSSEEVIRGTPASVVGGSIDLTGLLPAPAAEQVPALAASSCASTGGDPLALGLLGLLGMWAVRSQRRTALAPRRTFSGRRSRLQ